MICTWKKEPALTDKDNPSSDVYVTSCRHAYMFSKGSIPADICFYYCPGCGGKIHDAAEDEKARKRLRVVKTDE